MGRGIVSFNILTDTKSVVQIEDTKKIIFHASTEVKKKFLFGTSASNFNCCLALQFFNLGPKYNIIYILLLYYNIIKL